ncbi:MAG TPA: nucleotide exchange factor GrpE [Nitrososphaeraceae archaeon]|nr:nucleotide exchange factor GrpE [Nitrososphaeraceae archaeon]
MNDYMINNDNALKKDGKQVTDNTTTSSESLEEELKDGKQVTDNTTTTSESLEEELKDGKQVTDNTTTTSESLEEELMKTKTELKETKKTAETNLNKLKYLMADFDNYRKQIDKQMTSTIESNKANLLSRFLTIRDDYQRALDMIKKNKDLDEVFLNGLEGILKNLDNILQSEGVIPIETIGKVFDSNKHDVISFSYNDNLPENTITNEIRVGYMLNDKVLRPSLVEISKKKKI